METPALGMKALRRVSRQLVHPTGESAALPTTILQIFLLPVSGGALSNTSTGFYARL